MAGSSASRRSSEALFTLLCALFLSSCATTEIQSKKDTTYRERLIKTAVVSQVHMNLRDDFGKGFAGLFEERLSAALIARGVQVIVISIDELGLDASAVDQRIAEFGPSTVLFVTPVGTLRDGYGGVQTVRFNVSVGPPARTRARVWRASVEMKGVGSGAKAKAATLARDIISKLTKDGLL
jgi:hypothetical protein